MLQNQSNASGIRFDLSVLLAAAARLAKQAVCAFFFNRPNRAVRSVNSSILIVDNALAAACRELL